MGVGGRDAGMKYIVLTTKHVAGHCLWPSKHTDYTVANSTDKTNVVEEFCKACEKRGVLPGLYYNSYDNHNRFGSKTPSRRRRVGRHERFSENQGTPAELPPFTTSLYQSFQTAQITELLTQFGPIAETWIDIPGLLGRGYRTFLYNHIAQLQPETVIMMNNGTVTDNYNVAYAWPSDLISLERGVPPGMGHTNDGGKSRAKSITCRAKRTIRSARIGFGWKATSRGRTGPAETVSGLPCRPRELCPECSARPAWPDSRSNHSRSDAAEKDVPIFSSPSFHGEFQQCSGL